MRFSGVITYKGGMRMPLETHVRLSAVFLILMASLLLARPALADNTKAGATAPESVAQRELDVKHWLLLFPAAVAGITAGMIIWTRRRK